MRQYELVIVLYPDADEGVVAEVIGRVTRLISESGGEVLEHEPWGRRKLAYPIGKWSEGYYHLTKFQMEPGGTRELSRTLNLSEEVIRHMLINKPEAASGAVKVAAGQTEATDQTEAAVDAEG